jgi:hypothetical protein
MKRFVVAALCTLGLVGFVMAEEFTLQISKLNDDGTVTGTKIAIPDPGAGKGKGKGGKGGFGGGFGKGEEVTVKIATGVKVYKGKFDTDAKAFVKEGDDIGLVGLKNAFLVAENVSVSVGGNALSDKDKLEVTVKDNRAHAMLNGKDIDINTVTWKGKGPLATRVTTGDDGSVKEVLSATMRCNASSRGGSGHDALCLRIGGHRAGGRPDPEPHPSHAGSNLRNLGPLRRTAALLQMRASAACRRLQVSGRRQRGRAAVSRCRPPRCGHPQFGQSCPGPSAGCAAPRLSSSCRHALQCRAR